MVHCGNKYISAILINITVKKTYENSILNCEVIHACTLVKKSVIGSAEGSHMEGESVICSKDIQKRQPD